MTEESKKMPELIFYKESLIKSVADDVITLALLLGSLYLNHIYIADNYVIQIFVLATLMLAVIKYGSPKIIKIRGKKQIIEFLQNIVEEGD